MRVVGLIFFAFGLLASSAEAQQTSTYRYDEHGRLLANATAAASGNSTLSTYVYDSANNRTQRQSTPIAPRMDSSILYPGEFIIPEQALVSVDGRSRLALAEDGSLTVTCNGVPHVVLAGANGQAAQLVMQGDGNLVLYTSVMSPATALFNTTTSGNAGAFLRLQDDGNLVVYLGSTPLWATYVYC